MDNQTTQEIERKFLVRAENLPAALDEYSGQAIRQGYIVTDGNKGVRLRLKGADCYITVKSGQGVVRQEHEGQIPRKTFDALWPTTVGQRVEKVRYELPGPDGLVFELDIFEGDLGGLIFVEAEFASLAAAEDFVPPAWFGREVTEDERFNNSSLATNGLPDGWNEAD